MKIISRKQALAAGSTRYFTGKPCSNGHVAERLVSIYSCCECDRERAALRRAEDPAKNRATTRAWYEANRDRHREHGRRSYARNKGRFLEAAKAYRANNPEKLRAAASRRRARVNQSVPAWFGELDQLVWEEAAALCILRERVTKIAWHADHMIPLASSKATGLHVARNCQVIPERLNLTKSNRWELTEPGEWVLLS